MTPAPPLVSVVFSFRNEADNIPTLVSRLDRVFASQPVGYELIFVNDDSTDRSLPILLAEREADRAADREHEQRPGSGVLAVHRHTFEYFVWRSNAKPLINSVIPASSENAGRNPVRSIFSFETM